MKASVSRADAYIEFNIDNPLPENLKFPFILSIVLVEANYILHIDTNYPLVLKETAHFPQVMSFAFLNLYAVTMIHTEAL